jgi:phospholipid/cholesterol/gamma-HCH transport system substrate-binding protein
MHSKSNYALVGSFVLILSAGFIWGVLWISAGGRPQEFDRYVVYVAESVSGLNIDAPLKFRGVDVGKVEQISIDTNDGERIRLLLQVREGTPITEDTVATLEYQGLTGIANINLSGGRPDAAPLRVMPGEDYPVISSQPSLFSRLDATTSDLLTNLIQTTASINALLSQDNRANISRSIHNAALLTDSLAGQRERLDAMLAQLSDTLDNMHAASGEFPALAQQFSQSSVAITRMADRIRGLAETLEAASETMQQTLDDSSDGLQGFANTALPEITALVSELRIASENLRRVSETLAQDPSVLIYGKTAPVPGPGE